MTSEMSHLERSADCLDEAILCVADEIIRGILRRHRQRHGITAGKIGRLFSKIIGRIDFQELEQIIMRLKQSPIDRCWIEFVKSVQGIRRKNGKYLVQRDSKESARKNTILRNLSVEEYRQILLSRVICNMLHNNDINNRGQNNNTVLHLIASLPVESLEASHFQTGLLNLLLETNPDFSLKNDQDMTALHIIAGNHLIDPQNGVVVSNERGLSCKENTFGRLQKLKCLEAVIENLLQYRGPIGNSILHEWIIYHANYDVLSDTEIDIGKWITTIDNFQPNLVNDHGCTPLHYAFTNELVDFLCMAGSATDRKNVTGDVPLIYIIKKSLLHSLPKDATLADGTDVRTAFAKTVNINPFDLRQIGHPTVNARKLTIVHLNLDVFQNDFDLMTKDGKQLSCLSYLLSFVSFLSSHYKLIPGSLKLIINVVEKWLIVLGFHSDTEAMAATLKTLIVMFFELEIQESTIPILSYIETILKADVDLNKVTFNNGDPVLHYCCKKVAKPHQLKLVEILCEYGAEKASKNQDGKLLGQVLTINPYVMEIMEVLKNTKLKKRIDIEIQSVNYEDKLENLCRQPNPKRIDYCCYDSELIGKGAMSSIYLSINEKIGREMALKRMDKHFFKKEVRAEIEALKKLEQNYNIVNFYDSLESEDFYYLAIELMDGDLTALVQTKQNFLKTPDNNQKLAADIVCGLAFLHSNNMIHRDVKPGNVLYREKPELCLKLADFGLTKVMDVCAFDQTSIFSTASTSLCGTRGWMAPELVNRKQSNHTKESDMFALGLLLHFLFSKGFHPFHSSSVKLADAVLRGSLRPHELETKISKGIGQIKDDLTPEQSHLVQCLISNVPKKRPGSQKLLKQHCYFWSNLKKVKFMWAIGDQPEVAKPSSCTYSTFATNLQSTPFGCKVAAKPWNMDIQSLYLEVAAGRRKYDITSVVGLVRFFRNAYAHFEERSRDRKDELMNDHFFKTFPEFLVTVWIEVYNQGWMNRGSGKDMILRIIEEIN